MRIAAHLHIPPRRFNRATNQKNGADHRRSTEYVGPDMPTFWLWAMVTGDCVFQVGGGHFLYLVRGLGVVSEGRADRAFWL